MSLAALKAHADRLGGASLRDIVDGRGPALSDWVFSAAGIELDLTKQRLDADALASLLEAADSLELAHHRDTLLSGGVVNPTEGRPALHMAYREGAKISGTDAADLVARTQAQTDRKSVV